jgi:hypothetical protein
MEVWPNPTQIGVNLDVQFVVLGLKNEFIKIVMEIEIFLNVV